MGYQLLANWDDPPSRGGAWEKLRGFFGGQGLFFSGDFQELYYIVLGKIYPL